MADWKATSDAQRGFYWKYTVTRVDGDPEDKHGACKHFVLDLTHDPFAVPALQAYASACEASFPKLAADVRALLAERDKVKAACLAEREVTCDD